MAPPAAMKPCPMVMEVGSKLSACMVIDCACTPGDSHPEGMLDGNLVHYKGQFRTAVAKDMGETLPVGTAHLHHPQRQLRTAVSAQLPRG